MRGNFIQLRGKRLTMPELDELLFSCGQVMDYSASSAEEPHGASVLELRLWTCGKFGLSDSAALRERLSPALPRGVRVDIGIAGSGETSPGLLGKRVLGCLG
jgi:hypothetical protein